MNINQIGRWNRWGGAELESGYPRQIMKKIQDFVKTKDIVGLLGPRRAGKTTVLFQIMDFLERNNVSREAMLHINCEEPALFSEYSLELLDKIYETYREYVYPSGKCYVFIDEIQNIPQWERWVRARNESEKIKIFITGSSSNLMARELGTLLTGRHVSFTIFPLSFLEFLGFRGEASSKLTSRQKQNRLLEYLDWGGYPEVVLESKRERKELLLKQYFDDILFKDIALRHQVRDLTTLKNIAVFLLTQSASLVSYNRIANIFSVSVELAHHYCGYLEEAYVISSLSIYTLKTAQRNRHPKKVHALDAGLRNTICMSHSQDRGRVLESLIFTHILQQPSDGIYYIKNGGEIDIALRRGNKISKIFQVTQNIETKKILDRELGAFEKLGKEYAQAQKFLITLGKNIKFDLPKEINFISAQDFLLGQK